MTEQAQIVESPFAQRRIQLTLAMIALLVFSWLTIDSRYASPRHQHSGPAGGAGTHGNASDEPVLLSIEINTAPARELSLLPGVGPVLANRIVQNRRLNGRFGSLQDLARVHGIGPKKLAEVGPWCRFDVGSDSHGPRERLVLGVDLE